MLRKGENIIPRTVTILLGYPADIRDKIPSSLRKQSILFRLQKKGLARFSKITLPRITQCLINFANLLANSQLVRLPFLAKFRRRLIDQIFVGTDVCHISAS